MAVDKLLFVYIEVGSGPIGLRMVEVLLVVFKTLDMDLAAQRLEVEVMVIVDGRLHILCKVWVHERGIL